MRGPLIKHKESCTLRTISLRASSAKGGGAAGRWGAFFLKQRQANIFKLQSANIGRVIVLIALCLFSLSLTFAKVFFFCFF